MPANKRRSAKVNKKFCGQCKLEVNEEVDENIACDKCNKLMHAQCTKLDKRQFEILMDNESEQYICHLCKGDDNVSIKDELLFIREKLNQLDQLTVIKESISFLSSQYDDVMKIMSDNKKQLDVIKKENSVLKHEIKHLKSSVKFLNDEKVKNDCIVIGVQNTENKTAMATVLNLSKIMDAPITENNITDAYFLNNRLKSNDNKNLVIKFAEKKSKDIFMEAKSKLKNNEESKKIFVNDLLSKDTLSVLNHAKTLKTVGYKFVFPKHGKIFVKKNETSRAKIVRSNDDVDKLLIDATTNNSKSRKSYQRPINLASDIDSDDDDQADVVS